MLAEAAPRQKKADAIVMSLQIVHQLFTRFIESEDVATAVKLNALPISVPELVGYFEKHPEPYQPAANAWRTSPSVTGNSSGNGTSNMTGNGSANSSPTKRVKTVESNGNEGWVNRKIEMILNTPSTKPLWHNISMAPLKDGHKCTVCAVS